MQNLGEINKIRARRPYWPLLVLVLFLAGQIATTLHWHDNANAIDIDCALCVLSSATGAAIVTDALTVAGIALCTCFFIEITHAIARQCAHVYDSRAPPLYS